MDGVYEVKQLLTGTQYVPPHRPRATGPLSRRPGAAASRACIVTPCVDCSPAPSLTGTARFTPSYTTKKTLLIQIR